MAPNEIDGLFVLPGKAYTLLTDQLITGISLWFEPAQEILVVQIKPSIHISLCGLVGWLYLKHLLDVMTSSLWVKVP